MKVKELYYYPLKSGKGIQVDRFEVGATGPLFDRHWMVVGPKGLFFSQRKDPKMALITPKVENGQLILNAPDMPELVVPKEASGSSITAQLWDARPEVIEISTECSDWMSSFLGKECMLVMKDPNHVRLVREDFRVLPDAQVDFPDGFPFLLTSHKSLEDLNQRLDQQVPMNRFRANIVIDGLEPYAEDHWKEFRIGSHRFYMARPCSRCVMVNVNQDTGEKAAEPLKTLMAYRKIDTKIVFGVNLIHSEPCEISVGDSVELII